MLRRGSLLGALVVVLTTAAPTTCAAQARDALKFLGGGAAALVLHESGHLLFDAAFDAQPELRTVHFGPFPFFAIVPSGPLSSRQLYTVGSAGIWTHAVTSESIFGRHQDLRHVRAPFEKGMLAFDVLTSIGYAAVAFAKAGPPQRDTRSMAEGLGVNERAIGVLVLTPALLDVYRYYKPEARWARWTGRVLEASSVVLVVK